MLASFLVVTGGIAAATRVAHPVTLTVKVVGHGKVVGSPNRISCATTCKTRASRGATVRLVAQPKAGWRFRGWSGPCKGAGKCVIKLRSAKTLRATFVVKATVPPPAPPPPRQTSGANLWVDGSGGSCTRQATSGNYADSQACGSFQAAYAAAQCGDIVGVQPGCYGSQSIRGGSKSCSSSTQVTITSAPGSTCSNNGAVSMPSFSISVAYLKLAVHERQPNGSHELRGCQRLVGPAHVDRSGSRSTTWPCTVRSSTATTCASRTARSGLTTPARPRRRT